MADFSTNLKRLRKREKLSQDTLAEKLNVSRQTVSSWERGNSYPDLDMLVRISEVLHTDPNALLYPPTGKKEFSMDRLIPDIIPEHFWAKLAVVIFALGILLGIRAGSQVYAPAPHTVGWRFDFWDAAAYWFGAFLVGMVFVGIDMMISLLLETKEKE